MGGSGGVAGRRTWLMRFVKFNATNGLLSIVGNLVLMQVMVGRLGMNYLVASVVDDRGVLGGELCGERSVRVSRVKIIPAM